MFKKIVIIAFVIFNLGFKIIDVSALTNENVFPSTDSRIPGCLRNNTCVSMCSYYNHRYSNINNYENYYVYVVMPLQYLHDKSNSPTYEIYYIYEDKLGSVSDVEENLDKPFLGTIDELIGNDKERVHAETKSIQRLKQGLCPRYANLDFRVNNEVCFSETSNYCRDKYDDLTSSYQDSDFYNVYNLNQELVSEDPLNNNIFDFTINGESLNSLDFTNLQDDDKLLLNNICSNVYTNGFSTLETQKENSFNNSLKNYIKLIQNNFFYGYSLSYMENLHFYNIAYEKIADRTDEIYSNLVNYCNDWAIEENANGNISDEELENFQTAVEETKEHAIFRPDNSTNVDVNVGEMSLCENLVPIMTLIGYIIFFFFFFVPIILVLSVLITLVKCLVAHDENKIKAEQGSLIYKLIAAVSIYIIISVLGGIVNIVSPNWMGDCKTAVNCALYDPFGNGCKIKN